MKLKTAVISIVVSAALVAGVGYGAYYALQSGKSPIEVVPVSNVNTGYWGGESQSIFGSVTSKIAQTVQLNEEYTIDKIYVQAGDTVKEGDPLFSYDMTLQELELEMSQLSLQTQELTMTKLEKDLEKLKKTPATASLESRDATMTATSPEDAVLDEPAGDAGADGKQSTENAPAADGTGSTESSGSGSDTNGAGSTEGTENASGADGAGSADEAGNTEGSDGGDSLEGFQIEDVEEITSSDNTEEELTIVESVVGYERLVLAINSLFRSYGDELRAEEVGSAVEEAVLYYRKHLAEEKITTQENEDGSSAEVREYVLKDAVKSALGEEETAKLEKISAKLGEYQITYIEMLIQETSQSSEQDASGLGEALEEIQKAYDLLDTKQQTEVENVTVWQELQTKASELSQSESPTGDDTGNEDAPDTDAAQSESQPGDGSQDGQEAPETSGTDELIGETAVDGVYGADVPQSEQGTNGDALGEEETEEYTVTVIDPARSQEPSVLKYAVGNTVILDAVTNDPTRTFEKWEPESSEWATLEEWEALADWNLPNVSFAMPAKNMTVRAVYIDNMAQMDEYINTFVGMAETVLAEGAADVLSGQGKDFATELENAVVFYQQWLGELPEEILSTVFAEAQMQQYQLRQNIEQYLNENDRAFMVQQLKDYYRQLCIKYMRALFDKLDPQALVRADLEKAARAYALLGDEWRMELEQQWQEEQLAKVTQDGSSNTPTPEGEGQEGEDQEGESEGQGQGTDLTATPASIGDLLAVYNVFLLFQEYQQMDPNETEENRFAALQKVQQAYLKLTEEQKMLAAQNTDLVNTLSQYGLWEEPSTETDFGDPGDFGDFGDFGDDGIGYTASELKEMIEEKEHDIKMCALDIRELELEVKRQQRVVDGKVVKSTLDGTVVSIGTEEGDSEDDYFAKVTNQTGLYAKGSMNELSLEKIHVGDTISGMMTSTGVSFTAVVKESSQYPDPDGGSMSLGNENTNASYYPFYAEIENTEDIEEGEAEIQFSETLSTSMDGIYLEKYFVRTENDGRAYVFMKGEDGKLKKQYITTGRTIYSYAIEVVSGLEATDRIAFPYGKNVKEGAETKDVDALSDAYM